MRKIICVVIFVVTMITLQTGQVNDAIAGQEWKEARGNAFECSIAGVWESPVGGLATIVPLDPTGKRFSLIYDAPPPALPALPADVAALINWNSLHGIVDKIESNLYAFTLYRYGFFEGEKYLKIVVNGLTEFTDCDTRVLTYVHWVYNADGVLVSPIEPDPVLGQVFRLQPE